MRYIIAALLLAGAAGAKIRSWFTHNWGPWHKDGVKYIYGVPHRLYWRKCECCGRVDWQWEDYIRPTPAEMGEK